MFNLFRKKKATNVSPSESYKLSELKTDILYGYFVDMEEALEKKIILELRTGRQFKLARVYA